MIAALLIAVSVGQTAPGEPAAEASRARSRALLALHEADAREFAIYRDPARKEKLQLRREPVYRWSNPTRSGGQEGDVFLWTYRGLPEAIGCIFSHPEPVDRRVVCHELHSLSTAVLVIDRESSHRWEPAGPGAKFAPVPGAPAPAASAGGRLRQMTALAREFSGHSIDHGGKRWEFRLLPRPLYRCESTDPDTLDGALFSFVTSAGTDPELVLRIEARKGSDGAFRWEFSPARFSDLDLWLNHKDKEVWTAPRARIQEGGEPGQRYRLYVDRKVPEFLPTSGGKP